jgi:hypothetical protein
MFVVVRMIPVMNFEFVRFAASTGIAHNFSFYDNYSISSDNTLNS